MHVRKTHALGRLPSAPTDDRHMLAPIGVAKASCRGRREEGEPSLRLKAHWRLRARPGPRYY